MKKTHNKPPKRRPPESHMPATYIFEIRPGGPVKIGRTTSLDERLWSAQAFNDQLKLLAHFPDMGDTAEKVLHKRFSEHCVGREMFDGDVIRAWLAERVSE